MGKSKRWYGFFLTVFLLTVAVFPVQAADNDADAYTYTVTFLPGDKGLFDTENIIVTATRNDTAVETAAVQKSREMITVSGLEYGDRVSITQDILTDESMYYVRGIRKAGYDNSDEKAMLASNAVEHDTEYVVAYGVPGEMVQYTVRYVDENKNLLLERNYRGKIGEKVIAGAVYIPGYRPVAYNVSKTLVKDISKNILEIGYTTLPSGAGGGGTTTTVTTTETVLVPGQQTVVGGEAGMADANAGGTTTVVDAGAGGAAGAGAGAEADAGGAADAGEAAAEPEGDAEPQELINLDDEDTPLAAGNMNEGLQPAGYMAVFIGLAGTAILAALFVFFLARKRKKEKAGEDSTDES